MSRSLIARYLCLALPGHASLPEKLVAAVRRLATERNADFALVKKGPAETFLILHKRVGQLSFKSGLDAIRRVLLDVPLRRITMPFKFPMRFFQDQFPDGVTRDLFIDYSGDSFSPETFERASSLRSSLMDPDVRPRTLPENTELTMAEVVRRVRDLTQEEDEALKMKTMVGLYPSTSLGRNKEPNPCDPEQGERVDMPLEPGHRVRVLTRQDIFSTGTRRKAFSDEVFTVRRVSRNNPNAYYLKDKRGEDIDGKFYRRQLQALTVQPDRWEVRVLRRRRHRGRRQILVEWVDYPHLPAEWILEEVDE